MQLTLTVLSAQTWPGNSCGRPTLQQCAARVAPARNLDGWRWQVDHAQVIAGRLWRRADEVHIILCTKARARLAGVAKSGQERLCAEVTSGVLDVTAVRAGTLSELSGLALSGASALTSLPNWPHWLRPQHRTTPALGPALSRAQKCSEPASILRAPWTLDTVVTANKSSSIATQRCILQQSADEKPAVA